METNVGDFPMLFRYSQHIPRSTFRSSQPEIWHLDACTRDDCIQLIWPYGKGKWWRTIIWYINIDNITKNYNLKRCSIDYWGEHRRKLGQLGPLKYSIRLSPPKKTYSLLVSLFWHLLIYSVKILIKKIEYFEYTLIVYLDNIPWLISI